MKKEKIFTGCLLSSVVLPVVFTGMAYAGDIRIIPSLAVREIYTDNVDLDTVDSQSDFVTQVTPTINIIANGNRLNANINYAPNYFYYPGNDDDKDEIRHRLSAGISSELVKDTFFITGGASVTQQFLDRRRAIASSDVSITQNRATVQNYSFSPQFLHRFASFANFRTSYQINHFRSDDTDRLTGAGTNFRNSTRHAFSSTLTSSSDFSRIGWALAGNYSTEDRSSQSNFEQYGARLTLSYRISRMLTALGSVGFDERSNVSFLSESGGFVWDIGFRLVPGPRTSVSFRYGRRFSDNTYSADALYRISPNNTITLSYSDRIQTFQTFAFEELNTNPFTGVTSFVPFLDDSITRRKRLLLGWQATRGRTSYTLRASYEDVVSEFLTNDEERWRFSGTISRRLSPKLSVSGSFAFDQSEFDSATFRDRFWSASASASYTISESLNSSIEYSHSDRDIPNNILSGPANYVSIYIRASL